MAEFDKETTELTELEVKEVSAVDKGANNRKFLIVKNEGDRMSETEEIEIDVEDSGSEKVEKSEEVGAEVEETVADSRAARVIKAAELLESFESAKDAVEVFKAESGNAAIIDALLAKEEVENKEEVEKSETKEENAVAEISLQIQALAKSVGEIQDSLKTVSEKVVSVEKSSGETAKQLSDKIEAISASPSKIEKAESSKPAEKMELFVG